MKPLSYYISRVCVEILPAGYRRASLNFSVLIVRPDGSESWANVKPDSEIYAVLNAALFGA